MRIVRIFHPEPITVDKKITLTADASNHLINVLRISAGQPLVLFNGDDNEYPAELVLANKRKCEVMIDAKLSLSVESPLEIHLGQGISRGDRMDMVIQKAVELGIHEITPIITQRCGVKLTSERWQKKVQQWQKIVIGACEQCGRNQIPKIHPVTQINEWISQSTSQLRVTLHPQASKGIKHLTIPNTGVRLLIGPEGGFSESEVYATEEAGFLTSHMGPRVLRTETAAIAAIAALQSIHGDL